jgi:hypothetical protein
VNAALMQAEIFPFYDKFEVEAAWKILMTHSKFYEK